MTSLTVTNAVEALLNEGVTTPSEIADAIEGAEYDGAENAVILDPNRWYADDGNCELAYEDCDSGYEAAERYVDGGDWGELEHDISVTAWRIGLDADGCEVRCDEETHSIRVNEGGPGLKAQQACKPVDNHEGEYSTEYLAWDDEASSFVTWTNNGGTRGAHDRMDGEGKWRERYDMPEEISENEAFAWLCKYGYEPESAIERLAEVSDMREDDLIEAIGTKCSDDIYKLADNWYACLREYRTFKAGEVTYFDTLEEAEDERDSE